MMLSKGGSTTRHYVVFRADSGLKLYLGQNGSFGIVKKYAASWSKEAEAEIAAMKYTYACPWIIGKLEVVFEEGGDEQNLNQFTIDDLVFVFGSDRRTLISATPINAKS